MRVGALEIDPAGPTVLCAATPVALSQKFALLRPWPGSRRACGHQGGAAADRLGLSEHGSHQDHRLARLPPATQARRHGDHYVVNVWGIGYRLLDPVLPTVLEAA